MSKLESIQAIDDYFREYGKTLGAVASQSLSPLHVPGVTPLPDFSDVIAHNPRRSPLPSQAHVLTAAMRMMDQHGGGFVGGEMGVGKTLIGILAVHVHARERTPKGQEVAYRAMVLCPDHLIDKWETEILGSIPNAKILKFDSWREVVTLIDQRSSVTGKNGKALWTKPLQPEWILLGRNQAKWTPKVAGLTKPMTGFAGHPTGSLSTARVPVAQENAKDESGRTIMGENGRPKRVLVTAEALRCPKCGSIPRNKQGAPLGRAEIEGSTHRCSGLYLQEVADASPGGNGKIPARCERIYHGESKTFASECDPIIKSLLADMREGKTLTHNGRTFQVRKCGEPLWQWTNQPRRWPPAWIINRKLRNFHKYLLIDESHEQKGGDDVAQANACGALIGASRYTLCLSGTIIGGRADDLFALAVRLGWPSLFAEGFRWKGEMDFAKKYGIVEKIITTKVAEPQGGGRSSNSVSMRTSGSTTTRFKVAPGIMPSLYGKHLIGRSVFLALEQMADNLPRFIEYVANVPEPKTGDADYDREYSAHYFPVSVKMDEELGPEYRRVEEAIETRMRELLRQGSRKLLGTFVATTLQYPDHPYSWPHDNRLEHAIREAKVDPAKVHSVGYWENPHDLSLASWNGVVTPAALDPDVIRPKERTLIDICKHHHAIGNQVWIYVQMTDKRDVQPRLERLLREAGLHVRTLRAKDVGTRERYAWLEKNGRDYDVMISHTRLVSTGLDLFGKDEGAHNFNTLVFYQTGYSMFDLRQASRRAWRLAQWKDCYVYYLGYRGTMQHRAKQLMARKAAAALALDGVFSSEGLAGMASGDGSMSLAREIAAGMDDADMQRSWGKVSGGRAGGASRRTAPSAFSPPNTPVVDEGYEAIIDDLWEDSATPRPGEPSPADSLADDTQLVVERLVETATDDWLPEWGDDFEDDDRSVSLAAIAESRAKLAKLLESLQ